MRGGETGDVEGRCQKRCKSEDAGKECSNGKTSCDLVTTSCSGYVCRRERKSAGLFFERVNAMATWRLY